MLANREGSLRMTLEPGSARVHLAVQGKNPLGYAEIPASADRSEIARFTADSEYPDAPWQIVQFYRSRRTNYFNNLLKAQHRDHMLVPALVNGHWARDRLRTVDLFPSILAALGQAIPPQLDGEVVAIE